MPTLDYKFFILKIGKDKLAFIDRNIKRETNKALTNRINIEKNQKKNTTHSFTILRMLSLVWQKRLMFSCTWKQKSSPG